MAADLRVTTQAFFTVGLLIGSLSSGLPVPQDAQVVMPQNIEGIEQTNAGVMMAQELQQPQKIDSPPTPDTSSGTPVMIGPLNEVVVAPTMPLDTTSIPPDTTSISTEPQVGVPSVMPVVQQQPQEPAAAEKSREDCPEMKDKMSVLLTCDDNEGDHFHILAGSQSAKETQSSPEAPSSS